MNQPPHSPPLSRGRHFAPAIIILRVRQYLTHKLSYQDWVEMMAGRGVDVSHTTTLRWVQRFVPEFEQRWNRYDLNNLVERDHRRVKQRVYPTLGFKGFRNATIMISGVELAQEIRKGQFDTSAVIVREGMRVSQVWDGVLAG